MKQLKTMGYSALLLLLLCLTSSNGFLETNRNTIRQRNIDIRKNEFNDRNFFGSTWQRSSETSDDRRVVRVNQVNNRLFRLLPQENSRQGDDRAMMRNQRRLSARQNDRESRLGNSIDRRVSSERRDGRVVSLDRARVDALNDRRREILSIPSSRLRENDIQVRDSENNRVSDVRAYRRESRQVDNFDDRRVRNLDRDRRASTTRDNEREHRQRLSVYRQDVRENDRESRQLNKREIRSMSTNINLDNDRRSRQVNRQALTDRRQVRESKDNDREVRSFDSIRRQIFTTRDRRSTKDANQINRRVLTERREIRENDRDSRQSTRRDIRSSDNDRRVSDSLNRRREVRSTSRRENDRDLRQLAGDRRREVRQLTRREVQSTSERSRTVDNIRRVSDQRREDERMSRQLDNDRRREVRSIALDRNIRDERASPSREFRQLESRDADRSRNVLRTSTLESRQVDTDKRQEVRQLTRRDVRSISHNLRTVNNIRRVSEERREDDRSRQLNNDRKQEVRSISLDRNNVRDRRASLSRQELRESRQQERRDVDRSRRVLREDRRQIQSASVDRQSASRSRQDLRDSRLGRALTERRDRSTPIDSDRRREVRSFSSDRISDLRDIRVLERRLTREDDRRTSDATRRILTLSSKDENNNNNARTDKRQSIPAERRMATSFKSDVSYIPEMKSGALFNAAQLVLLSLLVAQVVSNSSKAKKNWFFENNFVTVTKEKVL